MAEAGGGSGAGRLKSRSGRLIALGLLLVVPPIYSFVSSPVERALVRELGGRPWMRNAVLPIGHHDVVSQELSAEKFEACARGVQGWDVIIVLYSYGSGSEVLEHAAIASRSSDLRDEIKDVDGYMNEGVNTVIVIRDERIVETFHLTMSLPAYDGNNIVLSRDG